METWRFKDHRLLSTDLKVVRPKGTNNVKTLAATLDLFCDRDGVRNGCGSDCGAIGCAESVRPDENLGGFVARFDHGYSDRRDHPPRLQWYGNSARGEYRWRAPTKP